MFQRLFVACELTHFPTEASANRAETFHNDYVNPQVTNIQIMCIKLHLARFIVMTNIVINAFKTNFKLLAFYVTEQGLKYIVHEEGRIIESNNATKLFRSLSQ